MVGMLEQVIRLRRDRIAAILAANVFYASETPAVQIQIPILSSLSMAAIPIARSLAPAALCSVACTR